MVSSSAVVRSVTVNTVTVFTGRVQRVTTASQRHGPSPRFRVEELAARSGVPVRTIREYQTWRLLHAPARDGRVGWYDESHVERLTLIGRLQQRGYSIAGIRDLLDAWSTGSDLRTVLGVDAGSSPETVDEVPVFVTEAALGELFPGDAETSTITEGLLAAGVIVRVGDDLVARSPAMLVLVGDAVRAGLSRDEALRVAGALIAATESAADVMAETVVAAISRADPATLEPMLRRGRVLAGRAVASHLIHQVGRRLFERAEADSELAEVIEHLRIGTTATAPAPRFGASGQAH
jgi:DNA-binding transcriptional MerR regulator